MSVNQSRSPRQLRKLAHECARAMSNDCGAAARLIVLSDVDIPTQDDGQTKTHLADPRQRLACTIGADFAKATHPLDLSRLQNREHLVTSRIDNRLGRGSHGVSVKPCQRLLISSHLRGEF